MIHFFGVNVFFLDLEMVEGTPSGFNGNLMQIKSYCKMITAPFVKKLVLELSTATSSRRQIKVQITNSAKLLISRRALNSQRCKNLANKVFL